MDLVSKKNQKIISSLLLALVFILISFINPEHSADLLEEEKDINIQKNGLVKVERVVDGDTVYLIINEKKTAVRLIGIDTPETVHPAKPVQCFGKEASDKLKEILENNFVKLELDYSQGEQDNYGRTLGYLFLEDGTNVNKYMIENGYAYEYTFDEDYLYKEEFVEAEEYAKNNQLGLWASGVCE